MLGTGILEERKSKFNGNLRVVKTFGMGTYIQANGLTQSGGIVESIWGKTLQKIFNSKLLINNCLILGLGGGTVAKLIRKNWPEAKITGVDIDPAMIELGRKYLGLNDIEVNTIIADASNFPNHPNLHNKKFDLVIVDLYHGDRFPKKFATENFLRLARSHLANKGIVVFNRLYYKEKKPEAEKFGKKLQKIFSRIEYYHPISNLMFLCSK